MNPLAITLTTNSNVKTLKKINLKWSAKISFFFDQIEGIISTYSHGTSCNGLSDDINEIMQLSRTIKIINAVQNGSVKIRHAFWRTNIFGRKNHNDLADEKRNSVLLRLTRMKVCKYKTFPINLLKST